MKTFVRTTLVCLCLLLAGYVDAADRQAKVYVILWFDTEDYLLPASDDAALRVAQFLTAENVPATFKVVGEKARTLERRKRTDVIAALQKHEIGYHSNYHSTQPTPALYLSRLGWDEGVAEFDRRERPGYDDIKRIFGVAPSCYGQPGSSWGPQVYGAMRNWGMPVYLDAGSHVQLDGRPHYYCGVLTLYKLTHTLRANLGGPKDLQAAEDKFQQTRSKLLAEGGGIVSIYYHPCEFVHKEFWDGVNFKGGANPPREQWKLPPAKNAEESKAAYEVFEGYVRFMKRFPDVQFITASQAAKLYRDRAPERRFSEADVKEIAAAVTSDVTFQKHGAYTLSAGEVLALLNRYVADKLARRASAGEAVVPWQGTPYGPSNPVTPLTETVKTDWSQFVRTAADVADYLARHGRVPTAVWLGSTPVPPESYLVALAGVAADLAAGKPAPETVELKPAKLAAGSYVADDAPNLWGWVIFPRGFRAPALMELARRQAWTIKPALLDAAAQ
jgi:hypothetical protein